MIRKCTLVLMMIVKIASLTFVHQKVLESNVSNVVDDLEHVDADVELKFKPNNLPLSKGSNIKKFLFWYFF